MGRVPPGIGKDSGADEADDRPTLIPDFDPEAFARDSEMRVRAIPLGEGGEATIDQARRLHREGDDESALFLLSRLLELSPLHQEATKLGADCRAGLEQQCVSTLGGSQSVLVVAVSTEELKSFELDNVSGFLLSLIDGLTDLETLLDLTGLPRLLALRHLRSLVDRGIVAVASHQRSP